MRIESIKVSKRHPAVKAILAATFPTYKGRKVKLAVWDGAPAFEVRDWDGGSRTLVALYNLRTGSAVRAEMHRDQGTCPEGWAVVEQSWFCGHDAGVVINVRRAVGEDVEAVAVDAVLGGQTPTALESAQREAVA
jgi:hypothetical protein